MNEVKYCFCNLSDVSFFPLALLFALRLSIRKEVAASPSPPARYARAPLPALLPVPSLAPPSEAS